MLSELQKAIISIVETNPGIGPGGVADMIGRDKSQTRRVMRALAQRGHLVEQYDGQGYAYYLASNLAVSGNVNVANVPGNVNVHMNPAIQENVLDHYRLQRRRHDAEPVTDLIPVRQSNGQVVHQLRDGGSKRLRRAPSEWLGGLDGQAFDDGTEIPQDDASNDWWNPPNGQCAGCS